MTALNWEVAESIREPGNWLAEAVGSDGECYGVSFYGCLAEARCRDFASYMNYRAAACERLGKEHAEQLKVVER